MKLFYTLLIVLSSSILFSQQEKDSTDEIKTRKFKFGAGVNFNATSFAGGVGVAIGPHVVYYNNKHHLELGPQFLVSPTRNKPDFGIEFTHKYYPNGFGNRYNLYFFNYLNYIHLDFENYHIHSLSHSYQYSEVLNTYLLSWDNTGIMNSFQLAGGYGFDINFFDRLYFALHMGVGIGVGYFKGETIFKEDPTLNTPFKLSQLHLVGTGGISLGYRFGKK